MLAYIPYMDPMGNEIIYKIYIYIYRLIQISIYIYNDIYDEYNI